MPGPLGPRIVASYASDDGNTYKVSILQAHADEGGFAETTGIPNYPRKWRMRYVLGTSTTGIRIKQPMHDAGQSVFVNGGTIVVYGISFTVHGRFGEKRPG